MRSFNELLQSPRALKALVAGGSVIGLLLLGLLAAPAVVRGKLERAAREHGFEASAEQVTWGLGRIWVRDVRVVAPGEDFELGLDAVSVGWFSGAVTVSGGKLRGSGEPERILQRLRGTPQSEGGSSGKARELSLQGLYVHWQRGATELEIFGARASRRDSEASVGGDLARVADGRRSVQARGVAIGLATHEGHRQLVRLETASVELFLGTEAAPVASGTKGAVHARAPPEDEPGQARAARLRALRDVLLPLAREGLADGANLTLDGVSARVERSGETLSFGPSRLVLARERDALRVSLMPSGLEAGVTPLALNLAVPLARGPLHVIAKGGPVSLSSLGVREGQMGLHEVRRATLAADGSADLSEDFESVELGGKLSVVGLTLQRKELSAEPVGPWSFEASLQGSARLDGTELKISSSQAHWGELHAELSGEIQSDQGHRRVQGRLRVPLAGCQSVLEAMPSGLVPVVRGLKLSGSFGIDLQVGYDTNAPKDTQVALKVQNECRVREVPPELSPHRFERPFLREVKAPDGSPMSLESGPGTPSWVSIDDISKHMESAILICEDAGFHAHAGFDFRALENALKDDLKQGRFARGASTVSMQLAKNLYLGREKTLSRKVQEAFLTMLLEQQLDKRRILELYLNVVELGPGLYGVGDAAQYYFATPARSLTLGQSLYLASLLPNPTFSHFAPDGKLSAGWLTYLHRLMQIAHKIKRVDDAELQAALDEEIAFRVPGKAVPAAPSDAAEPDAPAPPELDDASGP